MNMTTNRDRAEWAKSALDAFTEQAFDNAGVENVKTRISDLIVNLLHLAVSDGSLPNEDVQAFLDNALTVYREEVADEQVAEMAGPRYYP
jgi:predicted metal-dependent HD superfamily phosphohydrolase